MAFLSGSIYRTYSIRIGVIQFQENKNGTWIALLQHGRIKHNHEFELTSLPNNAEKRTESMIFKTNIGCYTANLIVGSLSWFLCSTASFGANEIKINLCNETDQKIYTAVAYEPDVGMPLMSRGWWTINAQSCTGLELPIGSDKILLYASAEGNLKDWQGQVELCVDANDKFDFNGAQSMACDVGNLAKKRFRELSLRELTAASESGQPTYTFKASDATRLSDAIRICNDSSDVVYLAYSQKSSQAVDMALAGWFKVLAGGCYETMKSSDADELYLFANNERGNKRWKGDIPLCTNSYDGFLFTEASSMKCQANNERRQLFKKIPMNRTGDFEYHLKPMLSEASRSAVQLCNQSASKIVVAIAYENSDFRGQVITSGWFGVKPSECSAALAVDSDVLLVHVQDDSGNILRSGSISACIHGVKAFEFSDATSMSCSEEGEEKKSFDAITIEPGDVKVQLP